MKRLGFYGDDVVELILPDDTRVIEAPPQFTGVIDYEGEVRDALRQPMGAASLRQQVEPSSRVTIAFDDPCLPLPPMRRDVRGRAIEVILSELFEAGVRRENIGLICANGLHRKWTAGELESILGKKVWSEIGPGRITNHDAEDERNIVDLGRTPDGHPVHVNRAVTESDLLVYVNVNWTSMNGGWKAVLVGLGDYESIRSHHNIEVLAEGGTVMDHRAKFHDILREMGKVVRERANVFTVETVLNDRVWGTVLGRMFRLDRERQPLMFKGMEPLPQGIKSLVSGRLRSSYEPIAVNAGSIDEVHPQTLKTLYRQQNVRAEGQTDALLLALPNISPYAAHSRINPLLAANTALGYVFNMHQGKPVVRRGGVAIILQPFLPGFNEVHHPSYVEFFERILPRTRDPYEIESGFEDDFARRPEYIDTYRRGYAYHGVHPFYVWGWCSIALKHLDRIIAVGAVDDSVTERMGFENADSLDTAMDMAAETLGKGFSLTHLSLPPIFLTEVE